MFDLLKSSLCGNVSVVATKLHLNGKKSMLLQSYQIFNYSMVQIDKRSAFFAH
jgi:hypothetical protein